MTTKKIIVSGAVALLTLAVGAVAFADSAASPMSLAINNSGNVALSGTVAGISGSTISVNSWLGTWTVNDSAAAISPVNMQLSSVKVGDMVKVSGTLGSEMSVNAKTINDSAVAERSFTGTIGNLNITAGTFTLATKNSGNVNVVANSNTKVYINGTVLALTQAQNGSNALVSGSFNASTNTVTADAIRIPGVMNGKGNSDTGMKFNFNFGAWLGKFFKKS